MVRPMVRHMLFATDFSESAGNAQDYAAFLTKAYEAKLYVVHVPESPLWYGSNAATIVFVSAASNDCACIS